MKPVDATAVMEGAGASLPELARGAPDHLLALAALVFAGFVLWIFVRWIGGQIRDLKRDLEKDLKDHDDQNKEDFTRVERKIDGLEGKVDRLMEILLEARGKNK